MPRFSNKDFVHLHAHTEYSKFDGLAKVLKSVMKAREMGFPAFACTDHGTIAAWIKFIAECNRKKDKDGNEIPYPTIKPILGCEFYLSRKHEVHDNIGQPDGRTGNRHLILIAKNWKGYQNLCQLSENSWVDGYYYSPRVDIEQVAAHSEGLICSSACLSSVINAALLADKYEEAKRAASIFKDIFREDFMMEVMYHGIDEEAAIIPDIFKLAKFLNVPVIATNDVHYVEKNQAESHEALMCHSQSKCILDKRHLRFPYGEFYLKSAEEMGKIFGTCPEVLFNTVAIAERVDDKDIKNNMGGMKLPTFDIPKTFTDPHEYISHLAWEGMKNLGWDRSQAHIDTLKMELNDIKVAWESNGYDFSTYFLIVWDYIDFANKNDIYTGCGRGSGYASVLLRALGITYGPDPLQYNLLWARFLGFDDKRFYATADFGLTEEVDLAAKADLIEEKDAEEEIPLEEDFDEEFAEASI